MLVGVGSLPALLAIAVGVAVILIVSFEGDATDVSNRHVLYATAIREAAPGTPSPPGADPRRTGASLRFATMANREAACHCGQLRLEVTGDPFVVSICHCLACKRRTGSAFGMQAAFTPDQVNVVGRFSDYLRVSDEADRKEHVFHFCPECGSQVFYTEPDEPDLIVVSVGSFADPSFPPPTESGYDSRRHPWLAVPATIERRDGQ